jgi:TolA-binding protein
MFFNSFRTNRRISQLETDVTELRRGFEQLQQEWDATSLRVTKTLRRLRSAEERREQDEAPAGDAVNVEAGKLPLTTVGASPERMERIRKQLAERGRSTEGGD